MKNICSKNHFTKILKSFRKKLNKTEKYESILGMNIENLHNRTDVLFVKLENIFKQTLHGQDRKTKSRFTDDRISLEYKFLNNSKGDYIVITYRYEKIDKEGFFGILSNGTHRILQQKIYLGINE
jgi:hypothetical protein